MLLEEKGMLLGEIYRLELHWDSIDYVRDNICIFENAYFTGPALSQAEKINGSDFIKLDFTNQYAILIPNYYTVTFHWGSVSYLHNKVALSESKFVFNKGWKKEHILNDTDYVIIDTKDHEVEKHYKNLVYYSYVVDMYGKPYNFRRN